MVIYVDTLIFTNIIIDYILLIITSLLSKRTYRTWRIIIASIIGGLSSLYIFVNVNLLVIDIMFKFLISIVMLLIANGKCTFKAFIFSYIIFLLISFGLNGMVSFSQNTFNSGVFVSRNFISYVNISPLILVLFTLLFYITVHVVRRISDRKLKMSTAILKVEILGKSNEYKALIDTGNSLSDPFSNSQVFILDSDEYLLLTNNIAKDKILLRQRLIPVSTVSSDGILNAIRCDFASVCANGEIFEFNSPLIASSKTTIKNDFRAVIPYTAIDRFSDIGGLR